MFAEGLNQGDGIGRVERLAQDGGIAEQDVKLHQNQFADGNRAGSGGQGGEKARASLYSAQS
jgi:hypothetical protein